MKKAGTRNLKVRRVKLSALVPTSDANALTQQAEDNGRSIASEIRLAIHDSLKKNGRKV
jgi:hypothetical protein